MEKLPQQQWITDFGQKVDLTARLRDILLNYPEGTSILKELVQNADDAKASTVRFVLDHNHYAAGSLLSPQLAQFQGPALLAYNDGVFTEKDFESISRIGDSKKREQAGKTGRFGVGFNSVYHVTDLPGFVSGEHLVFFDPHCKYLPSISAANPGKKINFVAHPVNSKLADQVAPFHFFGCDMQQPYQGTLFRFPLRTQEQAGASTISKQVYTPAAISALFSDLKQEAALVLLFLKSVCSIEVLELQAGQREPQLLFSCSVANRTPELQRQRALFTAAVTAPADQQVAGTYQLELVLRDATAGVDRQQLFLVSQRRGPPQLLAMADDLSKQFQVPLIAWGAVAADITRQGASSGSSDGSSAHAEVAPGRAFCFLPLPALTSLPVHVNGFFELSSNRRDVWHGTDMAGAGRLRAQWNEALLQMVVAPAYLELLTAAATVLGPGPQFNRLWPSCEAPEPWQGVVRQLYGHLPGKQLLWTAAEGGRWLSTQQCFFPDAACMQPDSSGSMAGADSQQPSGSVEQQQQGQGAAELSSSGDGSSGNSEGRSSSGFGPLGQALVQLGLPLAVLPGSVLAMMQKYLPEVPQQCKPSAARQAVKAHPDSIPALNRQQQLVPLLAYCLKDLDLSTGPTGGWLQQLMGLRLLPLADGQGVAAVEVTVGPARARQQLVLVVVDALEQALVQTERALLLDTELVGPALTTQLSLLASFDSCNLKHVTMDHLVNTFVPRILPAAWQHAPVVTWTAAEGSKAPVSWEWLQSLWQWLAAGRLSLQPLITSAWPLLPVLGSQLVPLQPLDQSTVVLPGADAWPAGMAELLAKLGAHVLDADGFELPVEMLRGHCVHSATGAGVAAALTAALKLSRQQQQQPPQSHKLEDAAGRLSAKERRLLRSFLLQPTWFAASANAAPVVTLRAVARQLPLYELANSAQLQQQQQQVDVAELADLEPVFVSLDGNCCLAPAGVSPAALSSSYVLASHDQEAALMVRYLGVQAPTAAHVYRTDILPKLSTFPQAVRDNAMLLMLRHLSDLQQQDRGFMQLLSQTPFLPSGKGNLHLPSQLYDPRSPELVALLDPDACFPAPAFCGDVLDAGQDEQQQRSGNGSGFSSLAVLQQLGLRSSAQLDTLVAAARYVEKVAADGDEDMAVARGKALLAFLNTESERLVGRHTAITSAAAAAMAAASSHSRSSSASSNAADSDSSGGGRQQQRPNRPGQGLFKAMQRGLMGLGSKLQSFDQPGFTDGPTGSSNQQQQEQDAARAAQLIAQQWVQLSQLCWCPVLSEAPDAALPWRDSSSGGNSAGRNMQRLAAPCAVRPLKDLWLVSAVKAVVDGECHSQVALAGLGWNAPLIGAELGSQLSALGLKHRAVTDAHLAQQLARIVPQLYMALDALPSTELSAAAAVLEGQPSVWVGNGFVDASRVAFKGSMDLSPHLYVLPLELTPFMEVLAALGAQEAFSAAQYTTVLQDLAMEAAGKPLQPKQLAQALGVAQALADVLGASGGGATAGKAALAKTAGLVAGAGKQADVVLVPDESGVMRPAADLAFDDAPWLDGPTAAADGDLKLVHPRIAAPVAEALGVASRRRLLLAASADCLALGLAGAGGAVEAFGQSEALTTRLRHIIQDYPEGPGVLLELVQNADDAGATKAAFLLDMRQHGTSSLLGPGMAAWQGPALLAYNNAIFSPGDFSAIASIGQDGKMSQPAAIGRFGLGFNAVYHLTDLPSFVSGQHLVLFDPHARYLPGASAAQPGLRVNLQQGRLLQQFPDAFAPYMHFGCSMEGSYPGTLFRFPLRSDATAATSNIKAQPTSPQQALQLLQSLTDVLPQALLFLKSLQEIEVYVVGDAGTPAAAAAAAAAGAVVSGTAGERDKFAEFSAGEGEPQLLFRASLKPLDGKDSLQTRITHFVSSGGGGSGAQQLDAFFRRLESVKEADLPCSMGKVQLSLSVSPTLLGLNSPVTAGAASTGQQDLGLVAAVSAGDGAVEVVQEDWLVCNQLGGGAARTMALDAWRKEKVKMIPWVGVATHLATHVSVSGYSSGGRSLSCRSSTGGRAFCFLPLPADTCLPVHINGYFELSSNRRDVWHGDDMAGAGQRRARWNEALLESAVAPAYAALLQEASRLLGPCADFWRLLPLGQGSVPEPWLRVAAAVYARLADRPVLHSPVDGGRWLAPQQALLPDAACYSSTKTGRRTGDGLESSSSSSSSSQAFADTQWVSRAQRSEDEVSGVGGTDSMMGYVPAPLQASVLAGLLVQCGGVPLVMGLSEEQQRCMLQWAPNTAKVSPAKARQLLRTQPALVADTLSRHLRQQQQQGSSAQPAAAVVLQYCLSDAAATGAQLSSSSTDSTVARQQQLLQALQQLNGLKLLPLADGQLQTIHAGLHTGTSKAGSSSTSSRPVEQFVDCAVYGTVSPQEQQLLHGLRYHMLHEHVGGGLRQQLKAVAAAGASNVHVLTAARLDSHILCLLLPSEWHSSRGLVEVAWQPILSSQAAQAHPQQHVVGQQVGAEPAHAVTDAAADVGAVTQQPQQQQQPSREFIQLCWRWLAERGDAADVSHWPLLPVTGSKLRLLQQPAQVLRAGDWTEQLMSALTKLGCCLLDTQIINFPCKALSAFVQEPTAAGLLDALAAAQAVSAAGQAQLLAAQQGRGLAVSVQARWQQQLQQLAPAERHHLRTYLLQAKWFAAAAAGSGGGGGGSSGGSGSGEVGGFNQQQLQVLRSLPVFEVHPPLPYEVDSADSSSSGGSGGSSGGSRVQLQQQQLDVGLLGLLQPTSIAPPAAVVGTGTGLYRSLPAQGSQQQLLLPPRGITNGAVLGSQFLNCESESEEAVLTKHLGVRRLPMQEYLMLHLAKAPQQLEPRALISTVAYILSRLEDLSASEPDLPLSIKGLQVIPTRAGLLGPHPGSARADPQQQQQQQGWQQLVLAAPVELFDPCNPVLVQLLGAWHFPAPPFDGTVDSRAAGGVTGAVAAAVEAKALLEALTLCGLRKELDLEVLLIAAQDIADLPLVDPSAQPRAQLLLQHLDKWAQQHPQPSPQEAELWKRLQTLPWCPVLVDPPEEGLPWPHAQQPRQQQQQQQTQPQVTLDLGLDTPGEQQTQQQQQQQWVWRAAPKMVAPAEMAWLVSGPLRLLAAPSPGRQLCELLGWSQQQVLRPFTASMQLAQLGEKYPAGTVDSPQLQSKLDKAATVLYSSLAPYVDDQDQMQLLQTNLLSTPCMWVGTGFAFPAVTALQAPSSSSSSQQLSNLQRLGSGGLVVSEEPGSNSSSDLASQLQQQRLLYLVPKAVQEDAAAVRTIQALHVPRHWDFAAYAIALSVLGERSANRALIQQELELSLLLADAAAIAQQGTSSTRLLQQYHVIMAANVLKVAAAGPGGVVGTGGPDLVVVPDADGVMAAPSELYFNDAAWLGAEGLRLAHAGLRQDTAEALGVRSMRLQHQSSESLTKAISCPTVDAAAAAAAIVINSCIQQHHEPSGTAPAQHAAHTSAATAGNTAGAQREDCASLLGQPPSDPAAAGPALTALLSILKWADGLCAAGAAAGGNGHARRGSSASGVDGSSEGQRYKPVLSFNVVLDERQHGTQSLLHSGLSRLQGPALCVTVKGISSLPADKLGQLLTLSGSSAGTLAAQRMPAGAAPAGGSPGSGSGVAAVQQGLASAWAVTDVVQAMSGDTTCYWDPSGQALAQTVKEMRQQAPRGRSINHTQPDLAQRFAHQWAPWSACTAEAAAVGQPPRSGSSDGSSGGSSGSSGRHTAYVADALHLRLPLRLQDQRLQGSVIAAAAGARLGLASRAVGLSLDIVRQQVAAFGPAAARSLLFLGHIQSVSVSTWPADSPAAVKLWQASLSTAQTASGSLRVGTIAQQQLAKYRDKGAAGPGGLLARIASGACGLGGSGKQSHKECWRMMVSTQYAPAALQQLSAEQQLHEGGKGAPALASPQQPQDAQQEQAQEQGTEGQHEQLQAATVAVDGSVADAADVTVQLRASLDATSSGPADTLPAVCRDSFNWLASVACEVHAPPEPAAGSAGVAAAVGSTDPVLKIAAVAVCTSFTHSNCSSGSSSNNSSSGSSAQAGGSMSGVLPAGGVFCGVALPGKAGGIFGQQQLLIDVQGTAAAAVLTPGPTSGVASAAGPVSFQQQHHQQQEPGVFSAAAAAAGATGRRVSISDGQLDARARAAVSVLVSAWHEMFVVLKDAGAKQQLYSLMPDLLAAVAAGNAAAAVAFKQVFQDAATMPIWQLRSGACVHIQEGAFLPPKCPPTPPGGVSAPASPAAAAAAAAVAVAPQQAGLGEEAREFIMQQLPLFQVPWPLVAQLEAAGVTGLRIISPAVLRPLLRVQQPKSPHEAHPFVTLTATQALQLLEYCCSDLTAADERRSSSGDGSSKGTPGAALRADASSSTPGATETSQQATGRSSGERPAVDVASVQAALPANIPQGAANVVADVFGPVGLAVLGGLASQMQQRLVTGVDDVLNAVMDAMGTEQEQQQQQQQQRPQPQASQHAAAAFPASWPATPPARTEAVAAPAGGSRAGIAEDPAQAFSPVNMNKVPYLRGLPVPTAGGTIAMLGVASLYVFPPECSPAPTALMPAHLLRQFVLPECMEALAWLFKYPEVRQQLRLTFYGLDQLAGHLKEALGPTWSFADTARGPTGGLDGMNASMRLHAAGQGQYGAPAQRATAACMPGTPGFPAVVAWDDGAAGGPYHDWLMKLWRVILQTVAAQPEWERSVIAGLSTANAASNSSGSNSSMGAGGGFRGGAGVSSGLGGSGSRFGTAGMADGIRNAAQRARGLAEAFAGEVAQALNVPGPSSNSASTSRSFSGPTAAGPTPEQEEADALWRPLLDWPLLPLADGRLLKLRYRELALAVLPEYQQRTGSSSKSLDASDAEVPALHEPWDWLLPALCAAGQPVLDPRFNFLIDSAASSSTGIAVATPAASPTAAAVTSVGAVAAALAVDAGSSAEHLAVSAYTVPPVPALLVQVVTGLQPMIGRPPFLGPLVQKLAATEHTLGGLDWSCSSSRIVQQLSTGLRVQAGPWDDERWTQLFDLLADHPPRDLQPDGVQFLRGLPMYRLVPQSQQQQQGYGQHVQASGAGDPGSTSEGDAKVSQLVALGSSTDWVLAPAAVLQACAGLRALASLPVFSTDRILEHRPGWGELYDILGVEPANLAQLLQVLLLPYLQNLTPQDRLMALEFLKAHWTQSRQYSSPLSTVSSFAAALKETAFVPAAQPAAGSSSSSDGGGQDGTTLQQQQQRLYKPAELFDPSVPLFAAVMATMATAAAATTAGSASAGLPQVLFPAAPFNRDEWLRFLRDLGLQHRVTKETFLQLAQHVAQQAAALAQHSTQVTAPVAASSGSSSSSSSRAVSTPAAGGSVGNGAMYLDVTGAELQQLQTVQAAADALLGHLRSHWTGLGQDRPFWQALGSVPFWPATLGVPGSCQARQVFAPATAVAQYKDWPLVWSVQPLLQPQREPTQTLRQQLGMRSPPPLSAVLQHLQTVGQDGGEDLLASWPDSIEPFTNVTLSILQHLDKEGLSPQQALQLSGAAFIPVAHASRLVAPQQMFLKLGGAALAPFAWEVPGQFVAHAALVKSLGVQDEPRAEDLVHALWRFAGQLAGRRMNPNELAACMRVLSYLSSRAVSSADASFLTSARGSNKLLVPTAGAQLMPASRVVHMGGAGGSMTAARLLGRTDPQQLVLAHPQLPEHVCRWLGVPALSECLVEELDPATSDLTPLDAIGTVQLAQLRTLLSSPAFASAAFSIAAAHATAVPALRQLDLGSVTRLCAAAGQGGRLQFVRKLATKVVLRGSKEDITRSTASREVCEFYEQPPDSAALGTLYVAVPPPGLPLSALLAQVLSRALGCPFTLPLHPLLEVPDAAQLSQLQPVLHAGGYDTELEGALAAGHVGSPLQPGDRALLRLRPLRHYEAGELVAVKRRLSAAATALPGQAAAAAADARASSADTGAAAAAAAPGGAAGGDEGGMVLCYGRVAVDAAPQPGQAAYRLSVEVAPGVYESVLSTQVFCFQSGAQHTQPPARATDSAASAEPSAATAGASSGSAASNARAAGAGADAPSPAAATQQASELASAVADMLSAAGMPLDLDKQQLLQAALAANAQLQQASAAVAELRQEAARKESELEAARSNWQCRVCFSRDVEQAFVGCGHMYCGDCMPSLAKCPVCRKSSQKIRLYR